MCHKLKSFIYNNTLAKAESRYTYSTLFESFLNKSENQLEILDVGIGTGYATEGVRPMIESKDFKYSGIDIDESYLIDAKRRFKDCENIQVSKQNFYDLPVNKQYDIIIFSSSFMLMPDQQKCLNLVKKVLKPGGKVYFLMALYNTRYQMVDKMKPLIKYLTTIDFGQSTYFSEFVSFLDKNGFKLTNSQRVYTKWNPIFFVVPVYVMEYEVKNNDKDL